jgi:hypothetical protein
MSRLFEDLEISPSPEGIRICCDNKQTVGLVWSKVAAYKSSLRYLDIYSYWVR